MAAGQTGRTPAQRVQVLIPAHDEEAVLADSLACILGQSRPPDHVLVVADNCTDETVEIARRLGVDVFETVGNTQKKAGALNQALDRLLPGLDDGDAILVMDADSFLSGDFVERALAHLARPKVGCVGGVFTGRGGGGLVGALQRNEYARYARDVERLRGRVLVLTGTATMFSAGALRAVRDARRTGRLPGALDVYDTQALTEDSELTLALLHLGFEVIAPRECALTTEVMDSWGALFRQRLRWKRGALENVVHYGLTRVTWRYWGRQVLTASGVLVTAAYLGSLLVSLAVDGGVHLYPLWIGVTAVFVVERIVTVHARGPLMMGLAALLVVEMVFDVFLQAVHVRAIWDTVTHAERRW